MNTITIEQGELRVEPQGLDKLWSLTRELRIPLGHVRGATVDSGIVGDPKGVRSGLAIPGRWAGTFREDGDTVFWNVSEPRDALVIELLDEHFRRLVLTVADPVGEERRINAATA